MPVMIKNDSNNEEINADKIDNQQKMIKCSNCGEEKGILFFYPCYSPNNKTGYTYICKDCCEEFALDDGEFTKDGAYRLCKLIDKPYKEKYYAYCQDKKFKTERAKIGAYIQVSNSSRGKAKEEGFDCSEEIDYISNPEEKKINDKEIEESKEIFGYGFSDEAYKDMYKLFKKLENNYPLRTEMHTQALSTYVKYAYQRDKAIAEGDMESADKWGKLASKQATDAKMNPNQLSSADLSDGLTCFSQLSLLCEKEKDLILLLPKYRQQPQDAVDYTIWQYINCARNLRGLPDVKYEEIYGFLEKKYEEFKKKYKWLQKDKNGNYDKHDIFSGE